MRRKTHEEYVEELHVKRRGEYVVLDVYTRCNVKTKHRHENCGYEWEVVPNSILKGSGCPFCAGMSRKTTEIYTREVLEKTKGDYEVLGEYTSNRTMIKHRHVECGYEWKVLPKSILKGVGCPKCAHSKGESRIVEYLESYKIKHIGEHKVKECRYKLPLPFDFAVFHADKEVFIEYDGEHHFSPVKSWGGDVAFKRTQRKDSIKTKYCADNGIPLIRIKYTEYDDIERILTEKLTEYGVLPLDTESSAIETHIETESA
jgi:predicted  nucleic acid-binding Zn-ribbon protein